MGPRAEPMKTATAEKKGVQPPVNPDELRAEADQLLREKKPQEAGVYLDHAADQFLAAGRTLQALAAKKLKWQALELRPEQEWGFIEALGVSTWPKDLLGRVLRDLSPEARALLIRHHEVVHYRKGSYVKRRGDPETSLYFVVGGRLREFADSSRRSERPQKPDRILFEGDHCGDIYPLTNVQRSLAHIETITRCELLRISRRKLIHLCSRCEELEYAIIKLCGVRVSDSFANFRTQAAGLTPAVRKGDRYKIAAGVQVEVENEEGGSLLRFSGLTYDFSVGGMCFIPACDKSFYHLNILAVKHGSRKKARVIFETGTLSMTIRAEIVRIHRIQDRGAMTPAVGIRFAEMTPALRGVFFAFVHHHNKMGR